MDVLTHTLAGLVAGRLLEVQSLGRRRALVLALIAANAPDAELAWFVVDRQTALLARHGPLHGLWAALVLPPLLAWVMVRLPLDPDCRRPPLFPALMLGWAAWFIHLGLDVLNARGAAILWPLQARHYGLDWLHPADPVILVICALALAAPWLGARARRSAVAAVLLCGVYVGLMGAAHGVVRNRAGAWARKEGLDVEAIYAFPEAPGGLFWSTVAANDDEVIQRPVDLFRPPRRGFRYFRGLEEPLVEELFDTPAGMMWKNQARVVVANSDLRGRGRVEVWLRDLANFRRWESPDRGTAYDLRAIFDDDARVRDLEIFIPPRHPKESPPFPSRPRAPVTPSAPAPR